MKYKQQKPGKTISSAGIFFKKLSVIFIGTCLYAAGISFFLDPNKLAPGGVVGLSVIASHTIGGTTGTWYFLINVPIIILGWWKFGGKFILLSFYAIALNSIFTNVFATFPAVTDNLLLASIAGSVLVGTGLSLVLRVGATTGGMDIVIKIIRKKYPALKTSTLFVLTDILIVMLSGFVFRNFDIAMYAFISVGVNGRVMDFILYGRDEAGLVYVISDRSRSVLHRILEEMEIGATILTGRGAYSNKEKEILLCVVRKRNIPTLQDIVKQEDPQAFVIVARANEIYGEGYKNLIEETSA